MLHKLLFSSFLTTLRTALFKSAVFKCIQASEIIVRKYANVTKDWLTNDTGDQRIMHASVYRHWTSKSRVTFIAYINYLNNIRLPVAGQAIVGVHRYTRKSRGHSESEPTWRAGARRVTSPFKLDDVLYLPEIPDGPWLKLLPVFILVSKDCRSANNHITRWLPIGQRKHGTVAIHVTCSNVSVCVNLTVL